jgi:uncharacterized protein (TIGR02145 family)
MKYIFAFLTILCIGIVHAQPQKVNYQAVALNASGTPIKNKVISVRLSIVDSVASGTILYTETHQPTTDGSGQFSVHLGGGAPTKNAFAGISWGNGNEKFLKVEMDAQGGSNYVLMGISQLVSVPYALNAGKANFLEDSLGTQFQIGYDENGSPFLKIKVKPVPNCGNAITYLGESYPTVQIGRLCWMAKNLNVGTMINSGNQTNNNILEKYCGYNDPAYCAIYGGLYQWAEAVQYKNNASNSTSPNPLFTGNVQGICPVGWHIPSDAEFCNLTKFLDPSSNCIVFGGSSYIVGGVLKSTSGLWTSPNTGANNSSGFSALPGGYRDNNGTYGNIEIGSYLWSVSEYSSTYAINRYLGCFDSDFFRYSKDKYSGFSGRCTQD